MGTTADKLTYLSGTKDALKTAINYTGANITNDTFRSYADKLKLGYIDIINNGTDTLYSNLPKVSGKGSNLSLTPTYEAPMRNIPYGDTLQNGTPTPSSPVPINNVTGLQAITISNEDNTSSNTYEVNLGKNLLDLSKCINGYINSSGGVNTGYDNLLSDYIKVESGKNYTVSLNTQFYNIGYALFNNSKVYVSRQNNNNKTTLTISIPSGTSYIRVWFTLTGGTALTPTNILQYEPMIEKGSQATSYSEYFTPIELNKIGDYEDYIKKSSGKNLFDKSNANVINAYFNSSTPTITSDSGERTLYIPCKPNTTYTISKTVTNRFCVGYTATSPVSGTSVLGVIQNHTASSITITTGETAQYLVVFYWISTDTKTSDEVLATIQIEENSTATEYEPYGKVWYICKKTRKLELAIANMNNSENFPGWKDVPFLKDDYYDENGKLKDLTDYKSNMVTTGIGINTDASWNNSQLFINKTEYNYTQTQWKNNFGGKIFKVVYGLQQPEIIEITNQELINQLEALYTAKSKSGITNIFSTSENLPMILSASALKVE